MGAIEESIIDHVIISNDLVEYVESIPIDEEGHHSLTKITKTREGIIKRKSDHNTIISKFQFTWKRQKASNRIEMYNLKNTENQKFFKEITSNNDNLSSIFDKHDDLNEATNEFLKKLEENIKFCFKKIRISEKQNREIEELFCKRKELRNKHDVYSKEKLKKVENKLSDLCAEANYKKICEEISEIKCDEGGINCQAQPQL